MKKKDKLLKEKFTFVVDNDGTLKVFILRIDVFLVKYKDRNEKKEKHWLNEFVFVKYSTGNRKTSKG